MRDMTASKEQLEQAERRRLEEENRRLREENERLRGQKQQQGSKDWMNRPDHGDGPGRVRRSG